LQRVPYDISRIDTSHPQYRKIGELIFPEWLQVTKVQPEERAPSQATYIHSEQEEALSHNTTVDFAETKIGEVTPVVKRQEKTIIMKEYTEVSCDAYFVDKTASSSLSKDTPNKESEKNVAQKSSAFPYLAPKGMRAFHPHTQTFRTNLTLSTGLQSKHLGTFNKLMESEYSSSLSYADFSSLWRAINGKNSIRESAGSSHKALLDADGKVVAGIFAHNKGMEYTKRTFAYLRDAVSRLGIDPVSEL
jgi:hypothetical protein